MNSDNKRALSELGQLTENNSYIFPLESKILKVMAVCTLYGSVVLSLMAAAMSLYSTGKTYGIDSLMCLASKAFEKMVAQVTFMGQSMTNVHDLCGFTRMFSYHYWLTLISTFTTNRQSISFPT